MDHKGDLSFMEFLPNTKLLVRGLYTNTNDWLLSCLVKQ